MRASDQVKTPFSRSHDQQIQGDRHDEILVWLHRRLKADKNLVAKVTGLAVSKIVEVRIEIERSITTHGYPNRTEVRGFVDLAVTAFESVEGVWTDENGKKEKFNRLDPWVGFVEVKSSVNLGETIRQINYYKAFQGGVRWSVCAPAFPSSDILVAQGVKFIEYTPEGFY